MPCACLPVRRPSFAAAVLGAALALGGGAGAAWAQVGPQTGALLDRLCAQTLRANEEDRLYGMISNAVRSTIRYRGGTFHPDLVDDAVQDSLDAMIEACPEITTVEEAQRLDMAIEIVSTATTKALEEDKNPDRAANPLFAGRREPEKLTAADLSEELSSQEIDQWLDAMTPRQRAAALFLYASDVTPREVAAALGEPPGLPARQAAAAKADLLHRFREDWREPAATPGAGPAMQFREAGVGLTNFMKPVTKPGPAAPSTPAETAPSETASTPAEQINASAATTDPAVTGPAPAAPPAPADPAPADPAPADNVAAFRITGISNDLYAGWSLLATAHGLPRGQRIEIAEPFLLEPDARGIKRMLVTGVVEIGDPKADTRRFLLKAYAIDSDGDAAGLRDSFHLGATTIVNEEAKKTLANPNLSAIEVARCLWHDYGASEDPGLCR